MAKKVQCQCFLYQLQNYIIWQIAQYNSHSRNDQNTKYSIGGNLMLAHVHDGLSRRKVKKE
jgi:hypothetical protein